ncbi:unnamed protein product [Nyctereutes procyonoides]|uniref:(raccoon dog) hypothetical protein n=1 Tax=Nyctereutes procyonoides TaxID=34880 RepID=A0A811YMJ2_NYCPR|nr:unnamed protein product [Nyctereutes procyonoides]
MGTRPAGPPGWLPLPPVQPTWLIGVVVGCAFASPIPPAAPGGQRILPAASKVAWAYTVRFCPRTPSRLCGSATPLSIPIRRGDLCLGSASACMHRPLSHTQLSLPSVQSQKPPPDSCPWKGYRMADPKTVTKAPGPTSGGRPGQALLPQGKLAQCSKDSQ